MSDVAKSLKLSIKEVVEPFGYKLIKGSSPRFEVTEGYITRGIFFRKVDGKWLVQLMVLLGAVPNSFPDEEVLSLYYLNPNGVVYSDWGCHKLWSLDATESICAAIEAHGLPFLEKMADPASLRSFLEKLAYEGHPEAPESSDDLGQIGELLSSEIELGKPSQKGVPTALLHLSLLCERLGNYEEAFHYAQEYHDWLMPHQSPLWQPKKDQLNQLLERLASRKSPVEQ